MADLDVGPYRLRLIAIAAGRTGPAERQSRNIRWAGNQGGEVRGWQGILQVCADIACVRSVVAAVGYHAKPDTIAGGRVAGDDVAGMVDSEKRMFGCPRARSCAQEHVETNRVVPTENLILGKDVDPGRTTGGVVIFVDLQIQSQGAFIGGVGRRRNGPIGIIHRKRRGVVLNTVVGAELQVPTGAGIGIEIIGKQDFLLGVVVIPDGSRGGCGFADGVSRASDHCQFNGFISFRFRVIDGAHLNEGLGLKSEDFQLGEIALVVGICRGASTHLDCHGQVFAVITGPGDRIKDQVFGKPLVRLGISRRDGDGCRIAVVGQNRGGRVFVVDLVSPPVEFQAGDDGLFQFPQLVIDRRDNKRGRFGPGGNGDTFAFHGVVDPLGCGSADDDIDGFGFGRVPGTVNRELNGIAAGFDAGVIGRLHAQQRYARVFVQIHDPDIVVHDKIILLRVGDGIEQIHVTQHDSPLGAHAKKFIRHGA